MVTANILERILWSKMKPYFTLPSPNVALVSDRYIDSVKIPHLINLTWCYGVVTGQAASLNLTSNKRGIPCVNGLLKDLSFKKCLLLSFLSFCFHFPPAAQNNMTLRTAMRPPRDYERKLGYFSPKKGYNYSRNNEVIIT